MKHCSYCNHNTMDDTAMFCPACGKPFSSQPENIKSIPIEQNITSSQLPERGNNINNVFAQQDAQFQQTIDSAVNRRIKTKIKKIFKIILWIIIAIFACLLIAFIIYSLHQKEMESFAGLDLDPYVVTRFQDALSESYPSLMKKYGSFQDKGSIYIGVVDNNALTFIKNTKGNIRYIIFMHTPENDSDYSIDDINKELVFTEINLLRVVVGLSKKDAQDKVLEGLVNENYPANIGLKKENEFITKNIHYQISETGMFIYAENELDFPAASDYFTEISEKYLNSN